MDSAIHHGEATKKINHGIPRAVLEYHAHVHAFMQSPLEPAIQGALHEAATQSLSLVIARTLEKLSRRPSVAFFGSLSLSSSVFFLLITSNEPPYTYGLHYNHDKLSSTAPWWKTKLTSSRYVTFEELVGVNLIQHLAKTTD
jgi:hypothetical protein